MSDFAKLADQYIAAWNETDPVTRRALIDEIWSWDGRYIDPMAEVTGRDQARFTWELGPEGTDALVVGFDVAQRDADGRLALVLGFLDKVPSL